MVPGILNNAGCIRQITYFAYLIVCFRIAFLSNHVVIILMN